jgi:predicted phosphoribosyltransferase/pimeloyl-ACP methyl ester carboxylesterase
VQYLDRHEAGSQLAAELMPFASEQPVVVALPRGGVPVAVEIASALGAPIEFLAVRKIGAPGNPELAVGAVAEDGTAVLDPRSAGMLGMTRELLEAKLEQESQELRRRVARYREGQPSIALRGRTAIVVDDGMATGMTELAAVRALRKRGAERIIVAVPVASSDAVAMLEQEADRVISLTVPRRLYGVGMWYRDFAPVSDEEVLALLANARTGAPPAPSRPASPSAPAPPEETAPLDGTQPPQGTAPPEGTPAPDVGGSPGEAVRPGETPPEARPPSEEELAFELDGLRLDANLTMPEVPRGLVVFAHGSGSSRLSPRNRAVAVALRDAGFASLLFDLLTEHEGQRRELAFDVPLLSARLEQVTREACSLAQLRALPVGYFGASTGAAAALSAAAALGAEIAAVVSRGGRPDLAGERLPSVVSPTLLIVGERDRDVLELNLRAADRLRCPHDLVAVAGAGHLFEEPGALQRVAELAIEWFGLHLA